MSEESLLTGPSTQDDEIKASMENGILTVKFPKSASDLAPKRIAIN